MDELKVALVLAQELQRRLWRTQDNDVENMSNEEIEAELREIKAGRYVHVPGRSFGDIDDMTPEQVQFELAEIAAKRAATEDCYRMLASIPKRRP